MKLIKLLLIITVFLIIIGGAISFESNDESWQIIIHKEDIFYVIKNGFINIYDTIRNLIQNTDVTNQATVIEL